MPVRREKDVFDASQPALLVTYGNTARKHRALDCDVIVLGRSSVCDFTLVSPEVAPVHCILVRVSQGWRLRDCSGRPGTRVNGKVVQEALLDDGDIIQVGAFSFQAHLPAGHTPGEPNVPPISPMLVNRLQRSRRRLLDRAQRFRKQLGDRFKAVMEADARLATERAELNKLGETLRNQQRDFELRMTRLELSERDLTTDRATLDKEYRTLHEELQRHAVNVRVFREESVRKEREIEEHRLAMEAALEKRWQEMEERARAAAVPPPPTDEEKTRALELRSKELDEYARHLKRSQDLTETPLAIAISPSELLGRQQLEMSQLIAQLRDVLRVAQGNEPQDVEQLKQERDEARQLLEERTQLAAEQIGELSVQVKELKQALAARPSKKQKAEV